MSSLLDDSDSSSRESNESDDDSVLPVFVCSPVRSTSHQTVRDI